MEYQIRIADEADAQAIHDIYGAYVEGTDITFTVKNPDVEAYRKKIRETKKQYPFYVAESTQGEILGYCCGSPLRPHDAYRWNVESTIMLSPAAPKRKGIATALYQRWMLTLKMQHFQYVYGVLVDTNTASIALHEALGFVKVGHFERAGYKDGAWLGIIWMQKYIGDPKAEVEEPIPFAELPISAQELELSLYTKAPLPDTLTVNGKEYRIKKLLGQGKGGYSYLAGDGEREYVLKQIHHEPCSYYQFGDKIQAELHDYERLKKIGIPMPELFEADLENERILKEYIEGETIAKLVKEERMEADYFAQIRAMCKLLYANNTNIDYFPTNFVVRGGKLYYIDYECNDYMEEWDFENWGIKYWTKSEE